MDDVQLAIKNKILSGENVFLTGVAGCGKSYIVKSIQDNNTIVTSTTGISAMNVQGTTMHSAFKLPIGLVTSGDEDKISQPDFAEMFGNSSNIKRIILDEVSMCRADYFDLIDVKLRKLRNTTKPFGGLQLVCVGDCYQLPPIVGGTEKKIFSTKYISPWFFSSKAFKTGNFDVNVLTKVYRQDNIDQVNALNTIREKKDGWEDAVDLINSWGKEKKHEVELILCSYNKDADRINDIEFGKIKEPKRVYKGVVKGDFKEKDGRAPKDLELKVGCRVTILSNSTALSNDEYRNGMVGTVIELGDETILVDVDNWGEVEVERQTFEKYSYTNFNGDVKKTVSGSFTQFPLKLGYATSIHSSQGLTLDSVAVDFGDKGAFTDALAYVALSRVRDLHDMHLLRPLKYSDIKVDTRVARFMNKYK